MADIQTIDPPKVTPTGYYDQITVTTYRPLTTVAAATATGVAAGLFVAVCGWFIWDGIREGDRAKRDKEIARELSALREKCSKP